MAEQDQFNVKEDVKRFVGWRTLVDILKKAEKLHYPPALPKNYSQGLVSILFLTGLRINEILKNKKDDYCYGLKPIHFDFSGRYFIKVSEVPILKKWEYKCEECDKTWQVSPSSDIRAEHQVITQRKDPESNYRTFRISKEMNVNTSAFIGDTEKERLDLKKNYIDENSSYYDKYVEELESFVKGTDREFLFDGLDYLRTWRLCRIKIGKSLGLATPPHWFRAQRACQLAVEQDADILDLLSWFQWDDESTAHYYASVERPPNMKSGRVIG